MPLPSDGTGGLVVENLRHRYGPRRVLDGISLTVPPGEVHCLVGPSGCGKSTTLRLIAGLEHLQAGRIALNGRLLAEPRRQLPPERRRVGLMFQDFALFPHLRVAENVAFGLVGRDRPARAAALLAKVNMTQHARSYPHTLSGGEQQRVALARALAPEPDLMLLDEAFSALDTELRARVRDDTLGLLRAAGTPTLLVTHDAGEAVQVGDRLYAMRDGRIVQAGSPAELYARPADAFVAGFFGPLNRFKGSVEAGRIATPLGRLPAPGLADGVAAEAVVRPEGVRVRPPGQGPRARVLARRDLGPLTTLQLGLDGGAVIQARLAGEAMCVTGEVVEIELDPRHLFVYPAAA